MQPDLSIASTVELPTDRNVSITLDETAACLEDADGARGIYALFRLPQNEGEYLLAFTSAPQGEGLFSPVVRILDANGAVKREVEPGAFVFRGSSLSLGLRIQPGEEYLLALSDAGTVGGSVSRINDATQTQAMVAGPVMFFYSTGSSTEQTFTYSHTGVVTVSTEFVPE